MAGMNRDIEVARAFHDRTAHSPASLRSSGHALDSGVKPLPCQISPVLPEILLPTAVAPLPGDALTALAGPAPASTGPLTLGTLAAVLFFSAGLTRTKTYPGGEEMRFRAAPSTGALYQTEVYVVAGAVEGLGAGVYHFSPGDFRLRRLREGDYRGALADAGGRPRARGVGARAHGRRRGLGPPLVGPPGGPVGRPGRPADQPPDPPALVRGGGLPRPPRAARGVDARHAGGGAGLAAGRP